MVTKIYPGEYKSLAIISSFIVDQASRASFSPQDIYAIQTAVDEACSNIIDHAYGAEDLGFIEVNVDILDSAIKITITDDGLPFNPDEVPKPDLHNPLENRKERGLGVYFMRELMDEVSFDFSNKRLNTLVMIKKRDTVS
ncbi:MAG: ATP-binding protein [Chloroflexota bacterium]